jgi:hypothetical protein
MSLDLRSPISPTPTPFTKPDFSTAHWTLFCPHGPCGSDNCDSANCRNRIAPGISQGDNAQPKQASPQPVADRRISRQPDTGHERRQFGHSHASLSPAAAELAIAIDQYKLQHRRRYITCEEMLMVISKLGYSR